MARHKMGKASGTKRKTGPKKAHRRKRVGSSGKLEPVIMNGLAVGGGIVAMNEISVIAGSLFPSLQASPVITGLVEIAIGAVAAWKGKSGWLMYAGLGGMGNGVYTLGKGFGVIGAAPRTMTYQYANRRAMGDPRLQFVAGPTTRIGSYPNNFSMVAGIGAKGRKARYSS